jgi:hypothetical protein
MTSLVAARTRATPPPLLGGRVVAALSVALTLTTVLAAFAAWWADGHPPWQDGTALELLNTASMLQFFAMLLAYLATCSWLDRSRTFARTLEPGYRHARGSLGVWLGWLVPIFDWWFPYQAVRDVRTATSRGVRRSGLTVWWIGFLTFTICHDARWMAQRDGADVGLRYDVIAAVGLCVALLPWLRIVREISEDQRAAASGG